MEKNLLKVKKLSYETKKKISEYQKNRKRLPHSEETRRKISEKAKGRDMTKLIALSVSKRRGTPAKNRISVYQFDLFGNFIKKFDSYTDASKSVNGVVTAFTALKTGRLKTYKGYIWKFEN